MEFAQIHDHFFDAGDESDGSQSHNADDDQVVEQGAWINPIGHGRNQWTELVLARAR